MTSISASVISYINKKAQSSTQNENILAQITAFINLSLFIFFWSNTFLTDPNFLSNSSAFFSLTFIFSEIILAPLLLAFYLKEPCQPFYCQ